MEGALSRLNTDYIDLYYQHRVDPNVQPEVVAEVMKELIKEGKIKALGLSNALIDYMNRAHGICPIAAIENQYFMVNEDSFIKTVVNALNEDISLSFYGLN